VERHHPDAVDVSSGIERRVGEKDPERMRAFVEAVTKGEAR
jgi:phosphoribosylanthranilate isomerase